MFARGNVARAPELNETSDGSPKEYKNALYLAFAALKVFFGWFPRINHYFLGPGHSHDEQDAIWKIIKHAFYTSRTMTFAAFITLCRRAFAKTKPEVIAKFPVFDWDTWLRPWMAQLHQHSKWRVFQFTRSLTNPQAVVMKWKESESTPGDFHGSDEHPNGIELLMEIPPGLSTRVTPTSFDAADVTDITKCFQDLTAEERVYWEEIISEQALPDNELPAIPEDYFDFTKFSYEAWQATNPETFQHPVTIPTTLPTIHVDSTTGIFTYLFFLYLFLS